MQLVRLSLFTIVGLVAAMAWFGRDTGVPDQPIGRATPLVSDNLMATFTGAIDDNGRDERLARALASDSSPETATLVTFEPETESEPAPEIAPEPAVASGSEAKLTLAAAEAEPQAPAPAPDYLVVTGSYVNMRGGPTTNEGVIATLSAGTRVEDLGAAKDGWREVRLTGSGERGFMAARFLAPEAP
ncbi:SH3 domain-containing protein [Maritimibacter sp. DP07]|uniref:SH3 domain-containing protein n=1 Tax=Maritimibacter harenae TaxID=2606218 RepID=A0A845M670_9RHOB|nr:SH3 domain-containing protein [Maritimibacter harenae]MZR15066.1 SH3 domain-containing protein [Maritimibacter harenae]